MCGLAPPQAASRRAGVPGRVSKRRVTGTWLTDCELLNEWFSAVERGTFVATGGRNVRYDTRGERGREREDSSVSPWGDPSRVDLVQS